MNNAIDMMTPIFHESLDERINEQRGVHVWTRDLDTAGDAWLDRNDWLSSEELSVAQRLRSPLDRRRFVRSHVVTRHLLANLLRKRPDELTFGRNRWGKPLIESPRGTVLGFNCSHSENSFLFGASFSASLGVDVEMIRDNPGLRSIAESFFSPAEMASLLAAPPSEQRNLFFGYWTLKEAYAKLAGRGLSADTNGAETDGGRQHYQTTFCVGREQVAVAIVWRHGHE